MNVVDLLEIGGDTGRERDTEEGTLSSVQECHKRSVQGALCRILVAHFRNSSVV